MKTPILHFSGLSTGYTAGRQHYVVAQGLTASLPSASLTALIGSNGAGKSTLLRTLAGLQPQLQGEILWMGKNMKEYTSKELAKTISVVLTTRNVSEALTVADTVALGRLPFTGLSARLSQADRDIVQQAMEEMHVAEWQQRKLSSLSDGERQRVMIAKALAQQTPVIMLDEPTAFLDFPGKVSLLRLLAKLAKEKGKAILFSTHDLELTFQLSQSIWLLSKASLLEGSPKEMAKSGALSEAFSTRDVHFDAEEMRFQFND